MRTVAQMDCHACARNNEYPPSFREASATQQSMTPGPLTAKTPAPPATPHKPPPHPPANHPALPPGPAAWPGAAHRPSPPHPPTQPPAPKPHRGAKPSRRPGWGGLPCSAKASKAVSTANTVAWASLSHGSVKRPTAHKQAHHHQQHRASAQQAPGEGNEQLFHHL